MNDTVTRAVSGETYFFRDHGQFDLLRLRLLPELIERRRGAKTLRLWSAGCASGEEAYSLAMLVDMLLPERDGWDIVILGSDIDEAALAKARHGHYGPWSFRMMPPTLRQRYFRHVGDGWALDERVRCMVTFRIDDLIGEPFPGGELQDMDLILCRNVFIYFGADAVSTTAGKLAVALCEGGYLMTGHTELIGHGVRNLQSKLFAEGVVYQRNDARLPVMPHPVAIPQAVGIALHPLAAKRAQNVLPPTAPSMEEPLAIARKFADQGEYARAEQSCMLALAANPLAPWPHFLLAQLAQLKGDFDEARKLLDKTLYLDPRCVAANLEQAALSERTGNMARATMLRRATLDILRSLPGDVVIEPYETTAAEMAQWIAQ